MYSFKLEIAVRFSRSYSSYLVLIYFSLRSDSLSIFSPIFSKFMMCGSSLNQYLNPMELRAFATVTFCDRVSACALK